MKKYIIRICFIWLLALLGLTTLYGQDISERGIVYQVPGMDKVRVHGGLQYRKGWEGKLLMDLYLPPVDRNKIGNKYPLVILVHGGTRPNLNKQIKDWAFFRSYGRLLAASGFAVVSFNHRNFYGKGMNDIELETAFKDVLSAIQFIRGKAGRYAIDPERVALWGFSASGNQLSIPIIQRMTFIKCIISYYALMDLNRANKNMANISNPEILKGFSFLENMIKAEKVPPLLIARAGKDSKRLNDTIDAVLRRSLDRNLEIDLLNHANGRHAFDIFNDDERTREIIRYTIDFIKRRLLDDK